MVMSYMHISDNRHEWNVRRVEEMQTEIEDQKKVVSEAEGFFNKMREKRVLRKLIKRQRKHGEEVFQYETNRNRNR